MPITETTPIDPNLQANSLYQHFQSNIIFYVIIAVTVYYATGRHTR